MAGAFDFDLVTVGSRGIPPFETERPKGTTEALRKFL